MIVVGRSQTDRAKSHDKTSAAGHLKHVKFIQLTELKKNNQPAKL